jgi:hypothetical protein
MKLPTKKTIDGMMRKAAKLWAMEGWEITWDYGDLEWEAENDPAGWTEKRTHVTISRKAARELDRKLLYRVIVHELGHCVLMPPWRGVSDWLGAKNLIPMGTRERTVFEEQYNTRENEVIDYLITQVFKL